MTHDRDLSQDDDVRRVLERVLREPAGSDRAAVAKAGIVAGYVAVAERLEAIAENPAACELFRKDPVASLLMLAHMLRMVAPS